MRLLRYVWTMDFKLNLINPCVITCLFCLLVFVRKNLVLNMVDENVCAISCFQHIWWHHPSRKLELCVVGRVMKWTCLVSVLMVEHILWLFWWNIRMQCKYLIKVIVYRFIGHWKLTTIRWVLALWHMLWSNMVKYWA